MRKHCGKVELTTVAIVAAAVLAIVGLGVWIWPKWSSPETAVTDGRVNAIEDEIGRLRSRVLSIDVFVRKEVQGIHEKVRVEVEALSGDALARALNDELERSRRVGFGPEGLESAGSGVLRGRTDGP